MSFLIKNLAGILGQPDTVTDVRILNNRITELGAELISKPNETIIDATGCIAYPGFVNTHHHLAQSVLKGIPAGLNQPLGEWLASVPYSYWPSIDPELMYNAARLGLYEGLRSGMTTCADHHYLYHAATTPELEDAVWQAASELGVRFTLCRGGANVMGSHKGLAKAGIQPETLDQTLERLSKSLQNYHQSTDDRMRQLVVAPTSLMHSTTAEQLKELAAFARANHLRMHSHLLEVGFDEQQAQKLHGMSAVNYAEQCHWLGEDVWFAHLVKATASDIQTLASTKTGIAHCPTSNLRLGSGIAPIIDMQKAGMPISIGVDGSASSESASMLQELNLAWLIHRAVHGADATQLAQVIQWGTQGGAEILGYKNLGTLDINQLADIVLYKTDDPRYCGVHEARLAPVMLGEPANVEYSFINGELVVQQGLVKGLDKDSLIEDVIRGMKIWKDKS